MSAQDYGDYLPVQRPEICTYLHVSVKNIGGVHVLDRLEELVDDVLLVNVLENVGTDDGVEVRFCERVLELGRVLLERVQ